MSDRPRQHYCAVALEKVKRGWRVVVAVEKPSRGEAAIASLRLMAEYADTASITIDREIVGGEVLDAATLKR
jgi:hypothetical protein